MTRSERFLQWLDQQEWMYKGKGTWMLDMYGYTEDSLGMFYRFHQTETEYQ